MATRPEFVLGNHRWCGLMRTVQVYTRFKPIQTKRTLRRTLVPVLAVIAVLGITVARWMWLRRQSQQTVSNSTSSGNLVSAVGVTNTRSAEEPLRTRKAEVSTSIPEPSSVTVPSSVGTTGESTSTGAYPRPVRDVFEAQLALACLAISPGSLDGAKGSRTRAALIAFQHKS